MYVNLIVEVFYKILMDIPLDCLNIPMMFYGELFMSHNVIPAVTSNNMMPTV